MSIKEYTRKTGGFIEGADDVISRTSQKTDAKGFVLIDVNNELLFIENDIQDKKNMLDSVISLLEKQHEFNTQTIALLENVVETIDAFYKGVEYSLTALGVAGAIVGNPVALTKLAELVSSTEIINVDLGVIKGEYNTTQSNILQLKDLINQHKDDLA